MGVRAEQSSLIEHWRGGSCHGNEAPTRRLTSRKLCLSLLFLLFSVSLVPKITQILHTTVPDTSLACNWLASFEFNL